MFRIAAFAHLAGVSPKVLRDYDEASVFRPAWVDPDSGYRLYSPAQLPSLRRLLALRDLGVGLDELRALVGNRVDLRAVLEGRIAALEAARAELDRRLAGAGISLLSAPGAIDVVVRDVRPELVATLDVSEAGGDVGRAFYELERRIRDARVRAPRPPGELLTESSGESRNVVFVPVRRPAPGLAVARLPAIRAATALHHGAYATFDRTRAAVDRWIADAGLTAAEPVRIVYLQFGAESELRVPPPFVVEADADLLTEVQVPVG